MCRAKKCNCGPLLQTQSPPRFQDCLQFITTTIQFLSIRPTSADGPDPRKYPQRCGWWNDQIINFADPAVINWGSHKASISITAPTPGPPYLISARFHYWHSPRIFNNFCRWNHIIKEWFKGDCKWSLFGGNFLAGPPINHNREGDEWLIAVNLWPEISKWNRSGTSRATRRRGKWLPDNPWPRLFIREVDEDELCPMSHGSVNGMTNWWIGLASTDTE